MSIFLGAVWAASIDSGVPIGVCANGPRVGAGAAAGVVGVASGVDADADASGAGSAVSVESATGPSSGVDSSDRKSVV